MTLFTDRCADNTLISSAQKCSVFVNKKLSYHRETAHQLHTSSQLTHWSCTSPSMASVLQLHNRLAKLVSTLSANKPCDMHFKLNRAFKVIQGHPYWCRQESRMVWCHKCRRYFWNLRRHGNEKTANSLISTTSCRLEDVPARNAFEYLQMIYIARN